MACRTTFPSCHEEKDPKPKSGRDLDPDKLVCATSCLGDVANPFKSFYPDSPTFTTDPRVIESIIGSVPVEHTHKLEMIEVLL